MKPFCTRERGTAAAVAVFALLDVTLVADHARTCKLWRDDVQGWGWDRMQVQ